MEPDRRAEVLLGLCWAARQVQDVAGIIATEQHRLDVLDVLAELASIREALDEVTDLVTRNYLERSVPVAVAHGDPFIHDELMRVINHHHRR